MTPPRLILREGDRARNDAAQDAYQIERGVSHIALRVLVTMFPDEQQDRVCIRWRNGVWRLGLLKRWREGRSGVIRADKAPGPLHYQVHLSGAVWRTVVLAELRARKRSRAYRSDSLRFVIREAPSSHVRAGLSGLHAW